MFSPFPASDAINNTQEPNEEVASGQDFCGDGCMVKQSVIPAEECEIVFVESLLPSFHGKPCKDSSLK